MTVSTLTSSNAYQANGVTTVFPYTFRILVLSDLKVSTFDADGIETPVGSGFTVSGVGYESGGNVTFSDPPANGLSVLIYRAVPLVQPTDYKNQGPFYGRTHESSFDRATMQIQQLSAASARSLRVSRLDGSIADLPPAAQRAGKLMAFDDLGDPTTALPVTDSSTELRVDLASITNGKGGDLVGFQQSGTGAVVRTMRSKNRDVVSVKDFGAIGDGGSHPLSTFYDTLEEAQAQYPLAASLAQEIDLIAFRTAFAASNRVRATSGTYVMGDQTGSDVCIDLFGLGDGVSLLTEGRVIFTINVIGAPGTAQIPRVFRIKNNNNVSFDPVEFVGSGYDPTLTTAGTFRGALGIYVDNDPGQNFGGLNFAKITGTTMVAAFTVARPSGTPYTDRIRGIHIGQIETNDCAYGYSGQNQGDGVTIGMMHCKQAIRCCFIYGISGFRANIFNENGRGSTGSVNIARFAGTTGQMDTRDIRIRYTGRNNNAVSHTPVTFQHLDLLGGTISDVEIVMNHECNTIYKPVTFWNYDSGTPSDAPSANIVDDIRIVATCDGQAAPIETFASYASKGKLSVDRGLNVYVDDATHAAFRINRLERNKAPLWLSGGVPPDIGNGSLKYDCTPIGECNYYTVTLTWGSTTSGGTGEWLFQLPEPASQTFLGSVWALDSDVGVYLTEFVAKINSGSNRVSLFANNSGGAFNGGNPITWATGDQLIFTIAVTR